MFFYSDSITHSLSLHSTLFLSIYSFITCRNWAKSSAQNVFFFFLHLHLHLRPSLWNLRCKCNEIDFHNPVYYAVHAVTLYLLNLSLFDSAHAFFAPQCPTNLSRFSAWSILLVEFVLALKLKISFRCMHNISHTRARIHNYVNFMTNDMVWLSF